MKKELKKQIGIALDQAILRRLDACAAATGLKRTTIIEQAIAARLPQIEALFEAYRSEASDPTMPDMQKSRV